MTFFLQKVLFRIVTQSYWGIWSKQRPVLVSAQLPPKITLHGYLNNSVHRHATKLLKVAYERYWTCTSFLIKYIIRNSSYERATGRWSNNKSCIRATLGPLIRVIQDYRYYTMCPSQYHGCCQYNESMSIPWVFVNTKSPCLYHESMAIPWVRVYTMSPCLYHESMSVP